MTNHYPISPNSFFILWWGGLPRPVPHKSIINHRVKALIVTAPQPVGYGCANAIPTIRHYKLREGSFLFFFL